MTDCQVRVLGNPEELERELIHEEPPPQVDHRAAAPVAGESTSNN